MYTTHSVAATFLPSLFNLNVYNRCIKNMLIDQQNEGIADEWSNFVLYNITGNQSATSTLMLIITLS